MFILLFSFLFVFVTADGSLPLAAIPLPPRSTVEQQQVKSESWLPVKSGIASASDELQCESCSPGWGVVSVCTEGQPTFCEPCPSNHYTPDSDHFEPCKPCSECGTGLYISHICSVTRDTICDACSNPHGGFSMDFLSKCYGGGDINSLLDGLSERIEEIEDQDPQHQFREFDGEIVPVQTHPIFFPPAEEQQQMTIETTRSRHIFKFYILLIASVFVLGGSVMIAVYLVIQHYRSRNSIRYAHLSLLTDAHSQIIAKSAEQFRTKNPHFAAEQLNEADVIKTHCL